MNKEPFKSQESFMLGLTRSLLADVCGHNQISKRLIAKDLQVIGSRTRAEGPEFLTKTLPSLAKAVDSALLSGTFQCPTAFKRYKGTALPALMRGLLERVFDEDGEVRSSFDATILRDIRQVCYCFYKFQIPHKPKLVEEAFRRFEEVDKDIRPAVESVDEMSIIHYAQEVVKHVLKKFDIDPLKPKNGPGSVANGLKPWERFRPSKFYPTLDRAVDYCSFYFYNDRHLFDDFHTYSNLEWEPYGIAKAMAVPKDSRGPRLISAETSEFMHYQQALKERLVPYLEANRWTRGQVNFTDQSINGSLALKASMDQGNATLDLKEASDRLSLKLVDLLYEGTSIHSYIMDTRSSHCELPSGKVVPLNKFAPMGSALCFPIQSLSFWAVCVGALLAEGTSLSEACSSVYVYGDDIIVPTDVAGDVIYALELVGLKVNVEKSCFTGHFRESCGVDAYKGVDITPLKLKKVFLAESDADALVSYVAFGNNLFAKGYWKASDYIRKIVETRYGKLPLCSSKSPIIGWHTWTRKHVLVSNLKRMRWNANLQQFEIKAMTLKSRSRPLLQKGWERMVRIAWYAPEQERAFDETPFDSSAFSPRYRTVKYRSWVPEAQA